MFDFSLFFAFTASFFISYFALKLFLPFFSGKIIAHPNKRSAHTFAIPRGGGLVFVTISFVSSLLHLILTDSLYYQLSSSSFLSPFLLIICLPLGLVGFLDDYIELAMFPRFIFQFITCFAIVYLSPLFFKYIFSQQLFSSSLLLSLSSFFLLSIFFVGITNFSNFMDGLDGLLAGCMLVILGTAFISLNGSWPYWCLLGSLIGFLAFNWSPASIFMGDVGSNYLGAVFCGVLAFTPDWHHFLALILVSTPLLVDPFFCLLRRFLAGVPLLPPHNLHLYQRLHQSGKSHSYVSCIYVSFTLLLSISYLLGGLFSVACCSVFVLFGMVYLDFWIAVPFNKAAQPFIR
ncbi:glycosyl transferase [Synechococcus sp. UW179A]|uniref:glycosyl transferase n=1 Tax=Synechococcus sp. UW179A TaxID=2575510 RepID=UPI000E0E30D3|nr:glycosyl transferase [Synechococcus sp. UW179A]